MIGTACRATGPIPSTTPFVYHLRVMQNRTVRLAKPIYETLPYAYVLSGLLAVTGSYFLARSVWADIVMVLGVLCVVGGIVILLKRRDARARRAEYKGGPLDEHKLN